MSISQNFPDEGPSLNLNFASSRILDPRITFTRTSTGTYLSNNGLVTIASANTPRFDHSYNGSNVQSLGLLIEESRTNLLLRSEEFDNASWTKSAASITANNIVAPDGTNGAEKLAENNTSAQHYAGQSQTISANTIYTATLFAKAAERTKLRFGFLNSSLLNGVYAEFDLSSGSVSNQVVAGTATSATTSIVSYPNGWYKCVATCIVDNSSTTGSVFIGILNASGNPDYLGDNTSGIYIWGAQLEAGAFPTSYIPTVASTVTRSADNASMTGTNFSSWYNSTAATGGTISVQARRGYSGNFSGYPNLYEISDGTNNNRIIVYGIVNSTEYTLNMSSGGVSQLDYVFDTISTINLFKTINSFATNSSTLCFNGSLKTTDTSVTLPSVNRLFIGCVNGFGNLWNGTISNLSYYPTRLTNSQLQNLTK